jgi:hypothetical protein
MIHRDFKPENVLVDRDGRVLVGDFGLVGISGAPAPGSAIETGLVTEPLTRADEVFGTPAYMPPEQHTTDALDARADQFAFCVALYEAVHGELPFEGRTRAEYVSAVCDRAIKPVPADRRVPGWLRKILARGMSPDPAERYASMNALLEELGTERETRSKIGATERAVGVGVAGVFLIAWVVASVELGVELSFEFHIATDVAFLALMVALGVIGRSIFRSRLNARIYGLGVAAVVGVIAMTLGAELLHVDATAVAVMHLLLLACFSCAGAVTLEPRLGFVAAIYATAFFTTAAWPRLFFYSSLLAHTLMAASAYIIFRARPRATR